jgi:hypothetical protein
MAMTRIKTCIFACSLFILSNLSRESKVFAGNEDFPSGARATGMGNAAVTQTSIWANFYNQALLAELDGSIIGIHHETRFGISQLASNAIAIDLPTATGTFGLCACNFGYSGYRESKTGIAYSLKLFKGISAGVQLEYLTVHSSDDSPTSRAFTFELGILSVVNKYIRLGVHVFNPANIQYIGSKGEGLLPRATVGLGYKPMESLLLTIEIEKRLGFIEIYRAGIEFSIGKLFQLRTGVSSSPWENSFGTGFKIKRLAIDVAVRRNQLLGYSPALSMTYKF